MLKQIFSKIMLYHFLIAVVLLYVISFLYPENIVLGNDILPMFLALCVIALILSIIFQILSIILKTIKFKQKNTLLLGAVFTIVNIVTVWILARLAIYTGFGISSFGVAIVLGVAFGLAQLGIKKYLKK